MRARLYPLITVKNDLSIIFLYNIYVGGLNTFLSTFSSCRIE